MRKTNCALAHVRHSFTWNEAGLHPESNAPCRLCKSSNYLPFVLGSWELNLLVILLEILGVPVERFIENLRLLNDIVLR